MDRMDRLWGQARERATHCWDSVSAQVATQLPRLSQQLAPWLPGGQGSAAAGEEVTLGGRRLRVVRKLGEGGYSFVYEVREVATAERPLPDDAPLALKKVREARRLRALCTAAAWERRAGPWADR